MASCKTEDFPNEPKGLAAVSGQPPCCGPDDIMEELQSDTTNSAVKSQKSGRFRRTALTFFGVRKSICILPSFFGGRSKNPTKWSSKKGICKSKTYGGLSKISHDDNLKGEFEYDNQRDLTGEVSVGCHDECSLPSAEHKTQSLTRQKRGLKSLFSSFKHHRNHKNVGSEKSEMIAMSLPLCKKDESVVQDNKNQLVTECLGSEPDVPNFENTICDSSVGSECISAARVDLEKSVEEESPKSEHIEAMRDDQMEEINLIAVVSSDFKESSRGHSEPCLILQTISDPELKSETPAGSSEQLNLIYGEVASLKSFDSLTGCGDIIADQEDDSITDSTVSGERSRNGGKRASYYLTYQGGGEEMASPEDLEEQCLHDFWGNNSSEEICCTCNQDPSELTADMTSSHSMDLMKTNSAKQASTMDTSTADVSTPAQTPQSEHQESVPNSDEGYYDSTTPGPEEGQEKTSRLRSDRLPRDSYSGDALYELFAPDESLISPHYEHKAKPPTALQSDYVNEMVDVTNSAFVPEINRLQISDLYNVEHFLDMPSTCSKSSELTRKPVGMSELDRKKNGNLNSSQSVSKNNSELDVFGERGNGPTSTKSINTDSENSHCGMSFGDTSDPDFEAFCEPKEQHLEEKEPVTLPYTDPQSPDGNSCVDDGGQTVCFSQALVDYTKNSQMLSKLHNSVDGLETNSAFTPNMQALPTIVTFDVVDMHNEGEYDEQIHMELEEDISSPYQEFEESYLQKDAFAECDYQMLDLYEQSLISNTWAIASLPRHLGLTRLSQSMPTPLSLDRRRRSLDSESLDFKMPDTHRENRAATVSCPQTEKDSERVSSPYYTKNVPLSSSDVRDSGSIMALSRQTRSDLASDGDVAEKVQRFTQPQVKHNFSNLPTREFPNAKSHLCSDVSDRVHCDLLAKDTKLYRQHRRPLQSDPCLPHSTFVYSETMVQAPCDAKDDVFGEGATNLQLYCQSGKSRCVWSGEGTPHTGSPLSTGTAELSRDMTSACSKLPKTPFSN